MFFKGSGVDLSPVLGTPGDNYYFPVAAAAVVVAAARTLAAADANVHRSHCSFAGAESSRQGGSSRQDDSHAAAAAATAGSPLVSHLVWHNTHFSHPVCSQFSDDIPPSPSPQPRIQLTGQIHDMKL